MSETEEITVEIVPIDTPDELYCRYHGQFEPQKVYLTLDLENAQLSATYDPHTNGTNEAVYHGRDLWIRISGIPTDKGANELLTDALPLAKRILAGATIEHDGSNWRGYLNKDAQDAEYELATLAEEYDGPGVEIYDAGDWFAEGDKPAITADSTDEDLVRISQEIASEAAWIGEGENGGYWIIDGLDEWLEEYREEKRQELRDELEETAERIETDTERRNELIKQLIGWKSKEDSTRAVANLAGMTHTRVIQITKTEDQ